MSRRATVIALVVAFVLGLSLGINGGLFLGHHFSPPPPWAERGPGGHGPRRGGPEGPPLERIARLLDLTPEQHERIRARIDSTRSRTRDLHDTLRAAIEAELTPEQRSRWRALQPRHRRHPGENGGFFSRPNRAEPGNEGDSR